MNVKELLANPVLAEYPILAGAEGLNREINQVGMIDAPDFDDILLLVNYCSLPAFCSKKIGHYCET
ncbi:MAG: PucR family transcriptional regulator ligand-binding domain-containing protein [Leuconostoc mesenteroides]|jgi:hypothetical protein|nr:PucR family transcriptional regulator ligand-binding domain-containing protein [Leuconostoc mesenteroides]